MYLWTPGEKPVFHWNVFFPCSAPTCKAGLFMVSSNRPALVATAGLTSSTAVRKQQNAWAKEYFSRWFFVTEWISKNLHNTATFSTEQQDKRHIHLGNGLCTDWYTFPSNMHSWESNNEKYLERIVILIIIQNVSSFPLFYCTLLCHCLAPVYLQNSPKQQKDHHLLYVSSVTAKKALLLQRRNKQKIEYISQAYLLQISSSSLYCWNCCLWLSRKCQLHEEEKVHEEEVGLPGKKAEKTQTSQLPIS